jgi:hypothetical protein
MVCPLCEHEQEAGDSCHRCGLRWAPQAAPPAADERCEGLEQNQVPAGPDAPIVPLPRLERGREEAPPAGPGSPGRVAIDLTGEEELLSRCPNCGLMGSSSGRCLECGVRLAASS